MVLLIFYIFNVFFFAFLQNILSFIFKTFDMFYYINLCLTRYIIITYFESYSVLVRYVEFAVMAR